MMMNMNNPIPTVHALWIGNQLGKVARSCLMSFISHGHSVHLHTYDNIIDVPDGITICDANLIIPKDKIIKHKATGSYALFSDIFRYELLKQVDGIYIDCDVYCIDTLSIPHHGYLLGYEDDKKINGAVLALPKDSELLNQLITIAYDEHFIPPWYGKKAQNRLKWKKRFGLAKHISQMPWGVIGPEAITYYVQHYQLESYIQPIDIFYPIHYTCVNHLMNAGLDIKDITTHRSKCIHLYNEILRKHNLSNIPENSILSSMLNINT